MHQQTRRFGSANFLLFKFLFLPEGIFFLEYVFQNRFPFVPCWGFQGARKAVRPTPWTLFSSIWWPSSVLGSKKPEHVSEGLALRDNRFIWSFQTVPAVFPFREVSEKNSLWVFQQTPGCLFLDYLCKILKASLMLTVVSRHMISSVPEHCPKKIKAHPF